MKALSFRNVSLVLALAVGVMVFWVATTPAITNANSAIGGCGGLWGPEGAACDDDDIDTIACENLRYQGQLAFCTGGLNFACNAETPGLGVCEPVWNYPCQSTGSTPVGLEWVCDDTHDWLCTWHRP